MSAIIFVTFDIETKQSVAVRSNRFENLLHKFLKPIWILIEAYQYSDWFKWLQKWTLFLLIHNFGTLHIVCNAQAYPIDIAISSYDMVAFHKLKIAKKSQKSTSNSCDFMQAYTQAFYPKSGCPVWNCHCHCFKLFSTGRERKKMLYAHWYK